MADHRPNRYEENGKIIYRASALGSCIKTLVALGLGMTPSDHPDWLLDKFQQGIDGEPVVIDMLRKNWRMTDQASGHQYEWDDGQLYVEIAVGSRVIIRGHADGIGQCYMKPVGYECEWNLGERRLIEVKCCSENYARVVLKELPPMYAWQVSCYGGFFDLPVMLAVGVKDSDGKVVNVVTKNLDVLPYTMAQVKQRVIEIEGWIAKGELPPCDHHDFPCGFQWLCDDVVDAEGHARTRDEGVAEALGKSLLRIRGAGAES